MATLNATYVRSDTRIALADVPLSNTGWQFEAGASFNILLGVTYRDPDRELAKLSAKAGTDVIWLGFQSAVDAFRFHHWKKGAHLRTLIYGFTEERVWETVAGTREPWERDAIFKPEQLHRLLKRVDAAKHPQLERLWRNAELAPNQSIPFLDARETARSVAEHYRLPGWS